METATEMPNWFTRLVLAIAGAVVLSGCTPHSDRQILWQIVHDRCVPNQVAQGKPDPCISVSLATGVEGGYVVLKDRNGIGQYLVMPTTLITGIEDAKLTSPSTPNYFTPAWQAKRLVEERLGTPLAREDVGIAVNSLYGRTQDLLHLHVDCLRDDVRESLHKLAPKIGRPWALLPSSLAGHAFYATRIDGNDVVSVNPFLRLSEGLNIPPNEMAAWTLVLVGAYFPDGKPGFVLLAAKANPLAGYFASGEALQDHDCRIRGTRVQP
jgi:CDP-diacylglycerol pyrophosphatase